MRQAAGMNARDAACVRDSKRVSEEEIFNLEAMHMA